MQSRLKILSRSYRSEQQAARATRKRRRGTIGFEFFLVFPILFFGTLAVFQFGITMLLEQAVVTAATEGAREAAKGAPLAEVRSVVESILGVHNIEIAEGSGARIDIAAGCSTQTTGDTDVVCTATGCTMIDEVRVTVCVNLSDGVSPVPDWLAMTGFSLEGKTLQASSLATRE